MFVGYSLKAEAEQAIEKFPQSMREKLKFLLTHSSSVEIAQQQNLGAIQQHHQNPYLLQQMAASNLSLNTSSNSLAENSQINLSINESFVGQQQTSNNNNNLLNNSTGNMEIDEKDEHLMSTSKAQMTHIHNLINMNPVRFFNQNFYEKKFKFLLEF